MLTQEFLNVLFLGLAINGIIVVVLVIGPLVRDLSRRRAAGRHGAAVQASGSRRPPIEQPDAGGPWFPDVTGSGEQGAGRPDRAADDPPALASSEVWNAWLLEESARIARYHRPSTIVLVELSGLDRLADRVGRAAADRLLPPVIETLRHHARAADRLARLGPTRFGVLLVETDEVQAINYVERIRSGCDLWLAAGAVALRLSIGWAEIRTDRPGEPAFLEAEERMYAERRRFGPATTIVPDDDRDELIPSLQAQAS